MHWEFKIRDHVFLKARAQKILVKLDSYAKLVGHYYGPFEIKNRIICATYRLALPTLMHAHDDLHVYFPKT